MGCKQSRPLEEEVAERVRTLVTEQLESRAEATEKLVREQGDELLALKETIRNIQEQRHMVTRGQELQGNELLALKETIRNIQEQRDMVTRGQELHEKEIKLELGERQASNQRLRQDLDMLKTKSTSESTERADPYGLDDAMLEAKLSSIWIEFEKLRAHVDGISASGGTGGSNASGFDRMKVVDVLNGAKNLSGADLAGLDLTSIDFSGASLKRANLTGATLTHAILTKVDAEGADFSGANVAVACCSLGCCSLAAALGHSKHTFGRDAMYQFPLE